MTTAVIGALVEVQPESVSEQSLSAPTAPQKAVPRTYPGAPQRDESIELQRLPTPRMEALERGPSASAAVADLEMSRPASPVAGDDASNDGVIALQSIWDPYMNRFRMLASCLMIFCDGMNDSAAGALIPYMESHYDIGYAVVSLIFVGNAFGFILAALFMDRARQKLGTAKTIALGELAITAGYVPIVCTAPFPFVAVSFFLIGFGMSINVAMSNIFCGGLQNGTVVLGILHGCYGIGGTIGPLIATAIVAVADEVWSRYYFITLGLSLLCSVLGAWSFWEYEQELGTTASQLQEREPRDPQLISMFSALKLRLVLLGAVFIFAYQGAEVSISGWVISFLIAARNGDPSRVGYVTAGFWAGITLGRFLLSSPAHRVGEKLFVYGTVIGAAIFEGLVWGIPDVLGDAVAVAIVGVLLGPVYPCAAAVFVRGMGRRERVSGIAVISAFGSSGGAVAPFTTGLLAQVVGTWVLHPICLGLFAMMLICWYTIPGVRKRNE